MLDLICSVWFDWWHSFRKIVRAREEAQVVRAVRVMITDSQGNSPRPQLDVYFPRELANEQGWSSKEEIRLWLDDGRGAWVGTVSITSNPKPYLLQNLTRDGEPLNITTWLLSQAIANGAVAEFTEMSRLEFRWNNVIDRGKWAPGRAPDERSGVRRRAPDIGSSRQPRHQPLSLVRPLSDSQIQAAARLYKEMPAWRAIDEAFNSLRFALPGFDSAACHIKTAAVNQYYGTQLRAPSAVAVHMARVISKTSDKMSDVPSLVGELASYEDGAGRKFRYVSFASKFAHFFLEADSFPIFDRYARETVAHHLSIGRRPAVPNTYARFCTDLAIL
jgi:hypothetical protein